MAKEKEGPVVEGLTLLLTPRYSLALWLSGATIVVLRNQILFLDEFTAEYGKFIVPGGILAFFAWAVQIGWNFILAKLERRHQFSTALVCLEDHNLSAGEKSFLYAALKTDKRSHFLNKGDEEVSHLLAEYVLVVLPGDGHYAIARDVWKYLTTNRTMFLAKWEAFEDGPTSPRCT